MWSESLRKLLFEPQYVVGFVGILFAALIASNVETPGESRPRRDGVCLTERYSMPKEQIGVAMKSTVFADHDRSAITMTPTIKRTSHITPSKPSQMISEGQRY
jgi:hypothetical protein